MKHPLEGEHEFLCAFTFTEPTATTLPTGQRCKHCGLTKQMILQSDITGCRGKHNNYCDDDAKRFVTRVDLLARVANDHSFHNAKDDQARRYQENRDRAKEFARYLIITCPPSRELSMALTTLDEVVFWANAAIARNE